ncbi:unnamed protein product [Linum tenue]|uniref:Uncharacterized protein n=1 Tax=Linum tenue TaxID=586396 RepID=A0AAV0GSU3_9ROSI|nr:unnamed protein product [Linum tenue]
MEFYGDYFHAPAPAGSLFSLRFGKDGKKMRLQKAAAGNQKGDNDETVHKIEVVEDGNFGESYTLLHDHHLGSSGEFSVHKSVASHHMVPTTGNVID